MATIHVPEFARDFLLSTIDTFADGIGKAEGDQEPTGLHRLAEAWQGLSNEERGELFTRLAAGVSVISSALPLAVSTAKKAMQRAMVAKTVATAPETGKTKKKKKDKQSSSDGKRKRKRKKN